MVTIEMTHDGYMATFEMDGKEYVAFGNSQQEAFQKSYLLWADDPSPSERSAA